LKKNYKLNNKLLKILLKENLILIIVLIIIILFLNLISGIKVFKFHSLDVYFFLGVLFVFNLPAISLFINYYIQNRHTKLEIDIPSDHIKISEELKSKNYKLSDIESSIYNIGIFYKNAIDNNSRESTIHSDFGYWDLIFANGDRYYLSNLLVDFLHEKAFVKNTKYRFRFLPYIDKSNTKHGIELKRKQAKEENRVEKFIKQYQTKNKRQLIKIIDNKNGYQKEAVEAAKIVLKKLNDV